MKIRFTGTFGGANLAAPHQGFSNIEFTNEEGQRFILNGETKVIKTIVEMTHDKGYIELSTDEQQQ